MVPQSVLICRLSAIGDSIETWPIATTLKNLWPDCRITWVVDCGVDSLLREHGAVDHVIRVPKGWLKQPKAVWQLRSELRTQAIEISIDPQGLSKSALVGWLSGAKRRIGFAPPVSREIAPWLYTETIAPQRVHLVDRQLELLAPLGVRSDQIDFGYSPSREATAWWERESAAYCRGKRYVVINAGAGWMSRHWDLQRYADVARHIHGHGMVPLILWGGSKEKATAEQIVGFSEHTAVLGPEASLPNLSAVIASSSFYVGAETGPMHLAAALGVPCISLHGPTLPEKSGPYGNQHITIQKAYEPKKRKTASNAAMLQISVADVCVACDEMIKKLRSPKATAA